MPNYGVKFNRSGKVTVPLWQSGTGNFSVKVHFKTGDLSVTGGLIGREDATSFIAVYANGKYAVKVGGSSGSVWKSSPNGVLSSFTEYFIEIGRTGTTDCYIDVLESDGVTVVDSVTLSNDDNFFFDALGYIGNNLEYDAEIYQVEVTGGTQDRNYLSSVNTGTTWSEITNNQDGTLVGLATDGTEWVSFPNESTPISFTGTIPNFEYNQGQVVSEDFSSYFSGSETPFTASNVGGALTATGLTLNSDFTLTGTATEGSVTGVIARGTDSTPSAVDSNAFNITVVTAGKTRAEIEAADTTGGFNPPFLLNDFDENDLPTDVFRFTIDTLPSAGTLETTPFSTFKFSGAPDGVYTFTYTGYKNDVSYGTQTVTLKVGVSDLIITISGAIPDGNYEVVFTDPDDKATNLFSGSVSVANQSLTIPSVAKGVGTEITGYLLGNGNPQTKGIVIRGVTV